MYRFFSVLMLAGICVGAIAEGLGQEPAKPKPAPPAPTETVIRLKVQAMPASRPLLKYRLLPKLREMNPGNPVQGYLKCIYGNYSFFSPRKMNDDSEKWDAMPLKDLPLDKLRGYGGVALREADHAARLDSPDWQILPTLKSAWTGSDYFSDLQGTRDLMWTLKMRARVEIADRRFDDALVTLQSLFAMSQHAAKHPSLIGHLVGRVAAEFAMGTLEEMLAQPGCPNLFWALAELPHPLVDMRLGVQGERLQFMKEFDLVDDKTPMSDAEVMKIVDRFEEFDRAASRTWDPVKKEYVKYEPGLRNWFNDRIKDQEYVVAARKQLIEGGLPAGLVERFSPLQAVFLIQKPIYMQRRDESYKGLLLPYWQMAAVFAAREAPLRPRFPIWPAAMDKNDLPFARLAQYENLDRARDAQARTEQHLALLRCVEALRFYAAEHGGQLPAKLADIKLPLPVDQFTGKAFVYTLDGGTAILHGTPPRRYEKSEYFNIRYEVTIAK